MQSSPDPVAFSGGNGPLASRWRSLHSYFYSAAYGLAVVASLSVWLLAIRAPLWLDETASFWQISAGFGQIMSRRGGLSPAYSYILWLAAKIMGTSEIALRVPSILAMLGAACLLYCAARELFDRDVAIITAVVFCVHPIVIFASIDARPYAFGALAIGAAIYILVHLRDSDSNWLAAAFGLAAACIVYFHLLFGVILPALALCLFAFKIRDRKALWRQSGVALASFALVVPPVIPDLLHTFHGRQTYVFFQGTPDVGDLFWTLVPGWPPVVILGATALVAAVTGGLKVRGRVKSRRVLLCVSLGLVPILILYGVSVGTPTNIFVERYRLVAVPGIALGWGLFVSRIDSRLIRVLFCVAIVSATGYQCFSSPDSGRHGYTWKYALEFAEKNASSDNAPVLICSDFPGSDYMPMPVGAAVKDSGLFTTLSYYKLSVPVVGLPRALNEEAVRVGSGFVQEATQRRERFLALGYRPSYGTLDWLTKIASQTYDVRVLAQLDGIVVREFRPRAQEIDH